MSEAGGSGRFARLGLVAVGVAGAAVCGYFGLEQTPKVVLLRGGVGLLVALEIAYGIALIGCLVAVPVLAVVVVRGRTRRIKQPRAARWLLLCVSVLVALALGEGALAAVRAKRGRGSARRRLRRKCSAERWSRSSRAGR